MGAREATELEERLQISVAKGEVVIAGMMNEDLEFLKINKHLRCIFTRLGPASHVFILKLNQSLTAWVTVGDVV